MTIRTVAFVTYNTVGNLRGGWHEEPNGRRALIVQNTNGNEWAVEKIIGRAPIPPSNYRRRDVQFVDLVHNEINQLWEQLQESISSLDHVVIYIGSKGSEHAIALAAQLPADKVTFVGCNCDLPQKEAMIQASGLTKAQRILCNCGGRDTMEHLFHFFMETGYIRPNN